MKERRQSRLPRVPMGTSKAARAEEKVLSSQISLPVFHISRTVTETEIMEEKTEAGLQRNEIKRYSNMFKNS